PAEAAGARGPRAHLFPPALCPHAELLHAAAPAFRTGLGHARLAPATAMAHEQVGGPRPHGRWGLRPPRTRQVIRKGELAGGTEEHVTAVAAEHHRCEAAPVQIEDRLIPARDGLLERRPQLRRERPAIAA